MNIKELNHKTYGIQGGRGSFNHQALENFTRQNSLDIKIEYLYTTEKVLQALTKHEIDYGQFALFNNTGGIVLESIMALGKYPVKIIDWYEILIQHHLMKRKEIQKEELTNILTHPQVLKQCQETLSKKFPHLRCNSGRKEAIDTAKSAELLQRGEISVNTAILGGEILSTIYDLEIIERNLQDNNNNNKTTFLLVQAYQ